MPITCIKGKKGKKKAVQIPIEKRGSLISEFRKVDEHKKMKTDLTEAISEIKEYESGE